MGDILHIFDLIGTFVFALSGGMTAVKHRLDLFGVLLLSFIAANFGGIFRDLLIGAVPPAAIDDWSYIAVCLPAGLVTFFWYPTTSRLRVPVLVLDAAGLALFAVAGALKAIAYHLNPLAVTLLGMLTGIGGGIARDVLVSETPAVLRFDLYAVAALAGAALVAGGGELHLPSLPVAIAGAVLCFSLRIMAIRFSWRLPTCPPQCHEGENQAAAGE